MSVKITNLHKSFLEQKVFEDFSFLVETGETVCLMGESGCGKSTLLKILMGIESFQSGEVFAPNSISVVFQEDRLIEHMSAIENVRLVSPNKSIESIKELLTSLLLKEGLQFKKVLELSGGERRRVAIARALVVECELLLMDEPFSALDDDTKGLVIERVKPYLKGKTVIISTHGQDVATALGARVIIANAFLSRP